LSFLVLHLLCIWTKPNQNHSLVVLFKCSTFLVPKPPLNIIQYNSIYLFLSVCYCHFIYAELFMSCDSAWSDFADYLFVYLFIE
jgi:hypothetical protein